MRTLKRREFLYAGALALGGTFVTSRLAFARAATAGKSRLVCIVMRGALDGLAAVPPYGDPDYAALRRELALKAPLALDGFFGLHPSLTFLRESYVARELVVFHAIASPYRERSHFDGQDVLESGLAQPHATQTGWLNRALTSMQGPSKELGVALGQNIPLVMRGPASVTSWSPSKLPALDEDTLERITDLYAGDPLLAARLADALAADAIADASSPMTQTAAAGGGTRYAEVVRAAAGFLRREDAARTGRGSQCSIQLVGTRMRTKVALRGNSPAVLRRWMGDCVRSRSSLVPCGLVLQLCLSPSSDVQRRQTGRAERTTERRLWHSSSGAPWKAAGSLLTGQG
jgi:uncharacterized protein (DUF1501 family)